MEIAAPEAAPEPRKGEAMKFAYASGSKALAGYTIKRGIGRGGFGEVYYATSDAGKEVALKLIQRSLDVELRGVRQCLNIKNPHLIEIYDIRESDIDESWIVMEYVSGGSLEDILAENPDGLSRDEALAWFHGMASGVACLHDRGIVHRDLKPGNLFREDGIVKIGDYGLSKFITASRRSGHTESIGTVHYMAPEVARGKYGKEIDIYALGVMLYEMLTGRVPFDGESVGEILMKHLTADPDLRGIEEPFRSVVARCLEKDPSLRFSSVESMLAALPLGGNGHQAAPTYAPQPPATGHCGHQNRHREPFTLGETPTITAELVGEEEPVARWIKDRWAALNKNPTTGAIVMVVVVLLYTASPLAPALWPLTFWAVVMYGIYWVARSTLVASQPVKSPPPKAARGTPQQYEPAVKTPPRKRVERVPHKTRRKWLTELVGSMLLSAVASAALCVLLFAATPWLAAQLGHTFPSEFAPEQFAMLVLVAIVGTWAVLIPTKFWEGREGKPLLRRLVMLLVGFSIGLFAFGLDQFLLVHLPYYMPSQPGVQHFPEASLRLLTLADGSPSVWGYVAYFGFLLLVLRWWRQTDPLRTKAFSVWAVAVCGLWALVLSWAWPFPQPWGMLWAVVISMSIQLASPWLAKDERRIEHVEAST